MTQVPADSLSTTSSYNYEQPLPSVARASTVTKVPPAKKITFYKSGDSQFAGVKMAINQRSFKSFNALMDDLSHRVPLPFGVRTITTPRGIHCISELDQLEDGGCYLCSDKKYVKPIGITSGGHRPGPPRSGRPSSTLRRAAQESKLEDYSSPVTHHGPRIPKKITLVKNGESGFRRSIILNRRNARSFKTLLDEISEILQFPVKKLYTVDGRKIDSMQALLHCPNVLVCVGREPFKPVSTENLRKHSVEKLPDLAPRSNGNNVNENNDMNFGLKAKKSVIHPRSSSSNRSMRFSLSSEKSYPNGLAASPDNGAPFSNSCSHPKPGDLVHSLVNDDIEKRVHVNKDGSLSVEMKVRFRLLNDETLQWSTQIKKSNLMNQMPCEESGVEDSGVDPIQKMNPEASSEADESLYPCDIDSYMSKLEESECDEAHCHSCGKKHQDYDIWKNPMHTSQREEPGVRSTWHTRSSCSSTSSRRRVVHKKMASVDSLHTTSSEEFSEHIVQESSSYSETIENRVSYRSIKKCRCQSDLSTGASNGEEQQEYTRTSTSNSQRPSSLGLMSHSSCENNLDTQDAPEDHEASKTNSQNEDENCCEVSSVKCLKDDVEEVESSRVGSVMSRSSLRSRQSKKNVCEETSSMGRSMSSSSLQKLNHKDNTRCSTPANSMYSKSSNCTTPRAKSEQDDHSDDNAVVSSFSNESCPKKEAEEVETEQEENGISEVSLVSAKKKPSQPIRNESSEGEQCSTQGTPHSRASDRNSKRSDSDEIIQCNASCSSRGSKMSKHSHIHMDAQSEMSVSSLESTMNKKKNSLHADDLRSCSTASNYSKSSCENMKKSIGDPMSHNSGSFHSNISSTSEAEAIAGVTEEKSLKSTTNGYSESSKGSNKRSHREENSKPSSHCSSFSSPEGKTGEGHPKMNSEATSSRHGSMSESVCSKGDLSTETGIRNGNPESISSRVSSKSEEKDKCMLTQISQESDDRCSQSNMSQSSKSRQVKTRHLHVKLSNSSRASLSETLSVCSIHCPAPPKGKPKSKKGQSATLKNSSISSIGSESVLAAGQEQKEIIDSSKATSYGSKSAATEVNDQKIKEIDDSCNRKVNEELEGTDKQKEGSDLMPSTLPNTSPEEVVQEWLSKIPSESLLMKYEMEDGAEEECMEATTEVSYCTNTEEISENEKAEKKNMDQAKDEVGKETEEGTAINEEAKECENREQISEVVSEPAKADQAECSQSVTSSQNNNRRDLPTSVQTSVQIMKALLSSKHEAKFDRSNSLPEVSPTMGRKLSNSANILITCLASLQLLDEESEVPSDKSKHLNKPRYLELLNIFQALWFGCTAEKSGPSSGLEASEQAKTASGFKVPKSIDYDFTPMSSSGVDVSSGSGGSGEETTAAARDCTLMAQKMVEFRSAGQVENVEADTELTEVEEQSKEEVQSSQPSTACSKSKGEGEAQPPREQSLTQKAEENKEDQCNHCENALEEGGEDENGENRDEETSKLDVNGKQESAEDINNEFPKENLGDEADCLATTNETNPNDADCGAEVKADLKEQLEKVSPNDPKTTVNMATSVGTSLVQQNSVDPDPTWVLRLLKKIEKEFMAHYVSAMNELKVRWNLENNQQMDEMILELKEEVSKRIQKSIEKELRKIKTRGGKKTPRPPDEPLKRESTVQTEQRRRRLQTMHKKSLFSDKNGTQSRLGDTSDLSFDLDEDTAFSAGFEASVSKQTSEEEYCPCDSCVRKKLASKPSRNPLVATNAPVTKAFDLQQILRLKKNDEEACVSEAAQSIKTIPRSSVEEAAENDNPNEVQPREMEVEGNELNKVGSSMLNRDGEGPEIPESQNCEMEDEVKDEEMKEEEKEEEEEEEEEEETKERGEEKEDAKEEEEEKEEEEIMKEVEDEEAKEEADGETQEKEDKEVKEERGEETKEEEEIEEEEQVKEEEETKEEERETKEEEEESKEEEEDMEEEGTEEGEEDMKKEDTKEEEEEVKEEERETKEEEEESKEEEEDMEEEGTEEGEEDMKKEDTKEEEEEVKEEEEETKEEEEEGTKEEEETKEEEQEEMKEEEEETKEEEEDMKEEEEGTKNEEEDMKEEEETKEEEEEVQGEKELTKEDEEEKENEKETKEEEEVEKEEENPKEEEEVKEEKEGTKDEEETMEEEEEANEEKEETQNEELEADEKSKAEDEAEKEAGEAEEPENEGIWADDEEETSECREDAGTDNSPEGDAEEGSEEAEQDEVVAVKDANPESEAEACSAGEENNSEEGDKYGENDEEPTSDDPDVLTHEKHKGKGNNKVSEKASKAKVHKTSKRLETLNKAATFSCYSSVGNFSQQSQKGSEDEGEEECKGDNSPMNNHSNGEVQSSDSSKPSQMYPDSEEEDEEDKASSCTDPLGDEDKADAEGADPKEGEHADEVQASKKKEDCDEIDQDDLDF